MDNFKDKTIAYQGAPGSYSHQCLVQNFCNPTGVGHITFEGAIQAVQNGAADYALLPIENSIAGRVMDMHHLLANSGLQILEEYYHKIEHCLLAKEGASTSDIKQVYSHPMALAQCRQFLHQQDIDIVPFSDTAQAAAFVSGQDSLAIAAIAASSNIDIYKGLSILEENIQDSNDNTTRFFLLGNKTPKLIVKGESLKKVTAIFFTLTNTPAALHKALLGFATHSVNITKLESFMPMFSTGSARFYIEVDGDSKDLSIIKSLKDLATVTSKIEILGTFTKVIV